MSDAMTNWRIEVLDPVARPDLAEACAAWNYGRWGTVRSGSLEASLRRFRDEARPDGLPLTVVAIAVDGAMPGVGGGAPVGMASLWKDDGPGTEDRTPWLASVYVHPLARKTGLGSALVVRAAEEAARLGFPALNLFTSDAMAFYERLGWAVRAEGEGRTFMEKVLVTPEA